MACATVACVEARYDQLAAEVNAAWVILTGILVFFMQCGFTMLEAGSVRTKNVTNIIFKNMADLILSAIGFWMFGWGVAYGGDWSGTGSNPFMGTGEICLVSSGAPSIQLYPYYFFQFAFAATATTIVSGAVAERVTTLAYSLFSFTMATFIYPVVAHWMWSKDGWLSPFNTGASRLGTNGAFDFAGGGVVHVVGGTAALVGAVIIGPRRGRFGPRGEPVADALFRANNFRPHNRVIFSLGALILWVGFYGFNCGSTLAISDQKVYLAGKVALNTTLAGTGAAITAVVLSRVFNGHIDIDSLLNGAIAGLASSTSGAGLMEPYFGLITGLVGGACYFWFARFLLWVRVDDPLQATAVHLAGGAWALVATGLFASASDAALTYGSPTDAYGLFVGGGWEQLGMQCLELVCVVAWTATWSGVIFGLLKLCRLLRVTLQAENAGLDETLHGGAVYDLHDLRELTDKQDHDRVVSWAGADQGQTLLAGSTIMESEESEEVQQADAVPADAVPAEPVEDDPDQAERPIVTTPVNSVQTAEPFPEGYDYHPTPVPGGPYY